MNEHKQARLGWLGIGTILGLLLGGAGVLLGLHGGVGFVAAMAPQPEAAPVATPCVIEVVMETEEETPTPEPTAEPTPRRVRRRDLTPDTRLVMRPGQNGSVFFTGTVPPVGLDWPGMTGRHAVRIARNKAMTKGLTQRELRESAIVLRDMATGRYYWEAEGPDGKPHSGTFLLRDTAGFVARFEDQSQVHERFRSARILYQRDVPDIDFDWEPDPRATRYRLLVASAGSAGRPLVVEDVARPPVRLPAGKLRDGRYQWRVERFNESGRLLYKGRSTPLSVRFDNTVPVVEIHSPAEGARANGATVPVSGIAPGGVEITVNGRRIEVAGDGRFAGAVPVPAADPTLTFRVVRKGRISWYVRRLKT